MLGIASGLGVWTIAVTGGLVGAGILAIVDALASMIPSRIYQMLRIAGEAPAQDDVRAQSNEHCLTARMRATLVNWEWNSRDDLVTLTYRVRHRGAPDLQRIAQEASLVKGVVETRIAL